ncbi:hypothetical protein N7536_010907 [Penicillium majusculum]|uniref:Uncharacterized protein n=1 Tax=Penicillium solitum TaxID=60172 RepID=A0A1V6R5A9_9EURO|nr:uncharacterized protein PENSOL_c016G02140 [Penicillium solitum]KAJ5688288.1 hypothetical protein N7536_010907 [Penicillium majusculum]OQD96386.1 hypothetical protein PENSOL_c016G02140 [Penicillium solitum]
MVNGSDFKNPNTEDGQNDPPEIKDPAGSDDIDERMTRDYKEAIDKAKANKDRLPHAKPSSTGHDEPTEDGNDISWRPDPSGNPWRTF